MEDGSRGKVRISDHVIAVIAGSAALENSELISMTGGLYEDFSKRISGQRAAKGVMVKVVEDEVTIDLRINVSYGQKIDDVCKQLQLKVKDMVERMTGLLVKEVNIRVEGIKPA
ncbi:Asp23/Gls24 family envelope stress response protein [Brevibacillus humidisoli]|uniref:Asp23/Gls24 family envelope stress response protein n=1 Tax=Brevibacillus humidisoli TaxID=2895522 RepID=UPI001E4A1272|nr:Asp23/Gls24 family envelope stress response protein [Brevibacillus humidisoli]UFJ42963.1 Asp23/Gls24 family envelope stress response protein [Brevibacillus humidisoli]